MKLVTQAAKASSENHKSENEDENSSDESRNPIGIDCDRPESHVEIKSTLGTHLQNSDTCDTSKNKLPDSTDIHSLDNNSDQLHMSESDGDGQSKADSSGDAGLERKNNVPLWGSKQFRRVTVTRSQEHEDQKSDNKEAFDYAVEQIVEEIRQAKGSEIAFSSAVQSVCLHNEDIKTYLGDKLTTRENRRVRNLSVVVHDDIQILTL